MLRLKQNKIGQQKASYDYGTQIDVCFCGKITLSVFVFLVFISHNPLASLKHNRL